MTPEQAQQVIHILQSGEELSPEWARILFPPEKREYELVYHGKEREEDILANTLAVPLQAVRTFGKNGGDNWQNMLIFGDNLQVMKSLLELKKAGKLCNADGNLPEQDRTALGSLGSTLAEFSVILKGIAEPTEGHKALGERIKTTFPNGLNPALTKQISGWLPKFLYFSEYFTLPGIVSINDFLQRKQNNQLQDKLRVFEALLELAGTTPEQVNQYGKFEDLNAALRAISNQISDEIFNYWTQNKHLDATLRFDAGRPEDPPPYNSGFVFRTRIDNRRHRVDTSFSERSSGFVWFFSFLVWFSQLQKRYGKKLLVLLDEPGLTLHARAQGDLLRYINERLRPKYQVIYTTHSPFMVDPDNLLSARTVEDVVTRDDVPLGTKIGDRVFSTDPDTISPLQRALDYQITQTLFVGRHTLLVEGPSDLSYIKWFSNQLKLKNRTTLDYKWTICIVGGVDRIAGFASLFKGNGLNIAAVVDFHDGLRNRIANAKQAIGHDRVLTADKYAAQKEADIEDVLGRDFYVALVNSAYNLTGSDRLPKTRPSSAASRVVKEVEAHFSNLPPRYEAFEHFKPASWLFLTNDEGTKLPGFNAALDKMEALIKDLNPLLLP